MSSRSFAVDPKIDNYVDSLNAVDSALLQRLRALTQAMPQASMQIGTTQGQFMAMLAKLIGAKRYLEIGVFTGYSSLVMAQALPDDGKVVGCDVSEEFTNIARQYWKEAGVDSKIDLHLGQASETLDRFISEGQLDTFDMAFIDADKQSIPAYLDKCLKLVRPNGLILVDNVLRAGKVLDDAPDAETEAVVDFNASLASRNDIEAIMLPLFDGLTLIRKK
jgi:predicted O-methyltransferase YrrM